MKQFFKLPGYYEGLKVRRIAHSGRLWFVRVISETNAYGEVEKVRRPYWFVMIRNFDLERDRASGGRTIGVWRFIDKAEAEGKFEELRVFYPAEEIRVPTARQIAARKAFSEWKTGKKPERISMTSDLEGGDSQRGGNA